MVYKIIDAREKRTMTKNQETAVIREFERFQPEGSTHIKLPQKEHLDVEFRDYACCTHDWVQQVMDKENTALFVAVFEETDLGNRQLVCKKCRAMSLWENGKLFAYDAIALVEKPEKDNKPAKRERR